MRAAHARSPRDYRPSFKEAEQHALRQLCRQEAHRIRQRVMDTLLSAFSALSEGLLIVDRDARIVWMNEQYPRHLGFSDPAEAIGKPVEDVIPNSQMRSVVTSGRPIMLDIMEFGSESFVVMHACRARQNRRDHRRLRRGGV